jgi:hypothetical protein
VLRVGLLGGLEAVHELRVVLALVQSFHAVSSGTATSTDCWMGMRRPSPTPSWRSSSESLLDGSSLSISPASFAAPNIFFAD